MPSSDNSSENEPDDEFELVGLSFLDEDERERPKIEGKVTRAKLMQVIGDRLGISQELCGEVVLSFFESIKEALLAGETVKIQNFATFGLRSKSARPGRNPRTGEEVEVSARRVISFRPSRALRSEINTRDQDGSS